MSSQLIWKWKSRNQNNTTCSCSERSGSGKYHCWCTRVAEVIEADDHTIIYKWHGFSHSPILLGLHSVVAMEIGSSWSDTLTDIQAMQCTLYLWLLLASSGTCMDTGATYHMTENRVNLTSYSNISNHITIASGHNILVICHGNVLLPNSQPPLTLNLVLHVPKLIKNLVICAKIYHWQWSFSWIWSI
jgi:hypothetical protein